MAPVERMPEILQCTGKQAFTSAATAAMVAKRSTGNKRRKGQLARPLESYRCRYCGFYHVGGSVRPPPREERSQWET